MFMLLLFFYKANTYHGFTIKELQQSIYFYIFEFNRIGGVMVSVLASSAVDRGFEPRSGQTKHYNIGICCFYAKHI